MTALTVNGSAAAASTLVTAGKLFNATGGTSGNTSTKVGSGTLFKQIFALGTTTNQTGVASIPAPTDSNFSGWMWDVTTLEGQLLQAGTMTPTVHLLASTGTTVTPTVQWFKRTSGGIYTQLASVAGSSIALTTSSQALTFTPPSMSDTAFSTGDKLAMWLWVNQSAGGATNSTISVVEATSASSAGVASEVQTVTQGFIPIVTTTYRFTEGLIASDGNSAYKGTILADSPIRYYRLNESSGTIATDLGSQAQNGTLHGGVSLSQGALITNDGTAASELFNGTTGYISAATTGLPTGANRLSMECWIAFPTSVPGAGNYPLAVNLGIDTATHDVSLYYNGDQRQLAFGFTGLTDIFSTVTVALGHTYYLAGTYDGTTGIFYCFDITAGVSDTTSHAQALNLTYGVMMIGSVDGTTLMFSGLIEEPAIYGTTLTAAQVAAHRAAGVLTPFTSPVTTVASFTESLTASDSFLKTDVALPTDGLSIVESVLVTGVDIPIDTNSIVESLLVQGTGNLTEGLAVAESLLATDTDVPTDSLIASDFGNMQAWGIDALTASDSLLQTDTALPTDALPVNDAQLASDGSMYTETNSASDSFSGSGTSQSTESLSTSDTLLEAHGYTPLDSLSASDSQVSGGAYIPLEGLAGTATPLDWDVYVPADDGLSIGDSFSSTEDPTGGGGPTTTIYSFEDDLSTTDAFTGQEAYLPVDMNTGSDAFAGQHTSLPTDGLSTSGALLKWDIYQPSDDALSIAESFASAQPTLYSFVDSLSAIESVLYTNGASMAEATSVLDTLLMRMGYAPFDTIILADVYTANEAYLSVESLSLLDVFHALIIAGVLGTAVILDQLIALALLGDRLVSIASLSDRLVSASTTDDTSLAASTTSEQPIANAVLMDKLG